MSVAINTLRDLYQKGRINLSTVERLLDEGKISTEEYNYIKGESE
jgi:hypothetical protein